jgi:hypothetical protein
MVPLNETIAENYHFPIVMHTYVYIYIKFIEIISLVSIMLSTYQNDEATIDI